MIQELSSVRKISLVTGLSFNIRIHVFIILARMEVVITYRAYGRLVPRTVSFTCLYTREGVTQSQDAGIPVQSSIQCLVLG